MKSNQINENGKSTELKPMNANQQMIAMFLLSGMSTKDKIKTWWFMLSFSLILMIDYDHTAFLPIVIAIANFACSAYCVRNVKTPEWLDE